MSKENPPYTHAQIEALLPSLMQTHRCDPRRVDAAFSHLMAVAEMLNECSAPMQEPALLFRDGEGKVQVRPIGNLLRAGRAEDCEASFPQTREMSRYHFRVQSREDGTYWVEDTGSANGTFLSGSQERISTRELRNGSIIEAGGITFAFVHLAEVERP